MAYHGLPQLTMDFLLPWQTFTMAYHSLPWLTTAYHGLPWLTTTCHGSVFTMGVPWISVERHRCAWYTMDARGTRVDVRGTPWKLFMPWQKSYYLKSWEAMTFHGKQSIHGSLLPWLSRTSHGLPLTSTAYHVFPRLCREGMHPPLQPHWSFVSGIVHY
jgi:hypothetical protein